MRKLLFLFFCLPIACLAQDVTEKVSAGDSLKSVKALDYFNELIPNYPTNAEYYFERGRAKLTLKNFNGALADLNKAIALNYNNEMAYVDRGRLRPIKRL